MEDRLLIQANKLSYKINDSKLFSNFSLSLSAGQAIHIKGSNGSGKSTLLRILGGITEPSKGFVDKKPNINLSYLGHKNALKTYLTVRDNLILLNLKGKREINNLLDLFGLNDRLDIVTGNLSFGQQKKLALIRIFINKSDLILLDEPFVGLDSETQQILSNFLNKKVSEGVGLIFTSHIAANIQANTVSISS